MVLNYPGQISATPRLQAFPFEKPAVITVSQARPGEAEAVKMIGELDDYLNSLYPPECNHLLSVEELGKPDVFFVMARSGARAAGCGALVNRGNYGELKRMYVRPEFRGTGTAEMILMVLEDKAMNIGLKVIRLETGNCQSDAIRFCEREGYTRCRAFGGYANNLVSLFFEKVLNI
jgi:putative acetyltransferase